MVVKRRTVPASILAALSCRLGLPQRKLCGCGMVAGRRCTGWSEDRHKGQADLGGGARGKKMTTLCADWLSAVLFGAKVIFLPLAEPGKKESGETNLTISQCKKAVPH